MPQTTCTAPNCTTRTYARDLCRSHYISARYRGQFKGTRLNAPHDITGRTYGALTVLRPEGKRWLCSCECGATTTTTVSALNAGHRTSCGDPVIHRRVPNPSYRAVHRRLQVDRGPANRFICVDCGNRADEWSYDHLDPDECANHKGTPYSSDPTHYSPRCVPCHVAFDEPRIYRRRLHGKLVRGSVIRLGR